jgi:hypothetical protein
MLLPLRISEILFVAITPCIPSRRVHSDKKMHDTELTDNRSFNPTSQGCNTLGLERFLAPAPNYSIEMAE